MASWPLVSIVRSRLAEERDMEMFLMGLCLSLLGVTVSAIAFGAATREADQREHERTERQLPLPAPRFFLDSTSVGDEGRRVPVEVLLLQLEHHVRLEQAAAESFLSAPTLESLHTPTTSFLVH